MTRSWRGPIAISAGNGCPACLPAFRFAAQQTTSTTSSFAPVHYQDTCQFVQVSFFILVVAAVSLALHLIVAVQLVLLAGLLLSLTEQVGLVGLLTRRLQGGERRR
ncbi:hypothetical protein KSF_043680 [Reticulibacter mediterranei]|uniref:Uncharacterized protein n=1 Tax=Reticulibacter mediterranei TaxID=2778369 RepID=A0A8J3IP40_9CHLR|nr:hypothetical protein [Reticulibacter mediterranei]GHO94320.1 hypothetical protein KSF_043680 [Reticulibacter mediterranei]